MDRFYFSWRLARRRLVAAIFKDWTGSNREISAFEMKMELCSYHMTKMAMEVVSG